MSSKKCKLNVTIEKNRSFFGSHGKEYRLYSRHNRGTYFSFLMFLCGGISTQNNTAGFCYYLYSFLSMEEEGATRVVGDSQQHLHSLPPLLVIIIQWEVQITGLLLSLLLPQISLRQQSWESVLCLLCKYKSSPHVSPAFRIVAGGGQRGVCEWVVNTVFASPFK